MPHVLVVDDYSALCALLQIAMEESGYRVSSAVTAGEALPLVDSDRPDVIVLDAVMPGRSGIELAADVSQRGIPVILMTGESCASQRLAACGWRHLHKPFRLDELRAEVRAVLAKAEHNLEMVRASLQRLRDTHHFDPLRVSLLRSRDAREQRRDRDTPTAQEIAAARGS